MSDDPRMSEHPEADHPAPDAPNQDRDDIGEPTDPTDPLKRGGEEGEDEDLPGADPVMEPFSPD